MTAPPRMTWRLRTPRCGSGPERSRVEPAYDGSCGALLRLVRFGLVGVMGREVFFLVLHGQAPCGVVVAGHSPALSARLDDGFDGALERPSFLEATMPSFFHAPLP